MAVSTRKHVPDDAGRSTHAARSATHDGAGAQSADAPHAREAHHLEQLAGSHRQGNTWNAGMPLSSGSNAHRTNTPEEMREALTSSHNWLEGDLRLDSSGTPVLSHDADKAADGLRLDQWLRIGAASERGLKLDVKDDRAIPKMMDAIEKSGVPDERLMINVGGVSDSTLRELRQRFPNAWLALNPDTLRDSYPKSEIDRVVHQAKVVGGNVVFPLRWDIAGDDVIKSLKPYGKVSIWTQDNKGTPDNTAAEVRSLRSRGVDGIIDLAPPSSIKQKFIQFMDRLWESDAAHGARALTGFGLKLASSAVSQARDGAVAATSGIVHLAGSGVSTARKLASHVPIVGGLFD